ncbi:MAG: radical SAM protein [Caldilineales bacterium]|nr:radical SAM protein [Caldilineales bacterium]
MSGDRFAELLEHLKRRHIPFTVMWELTHRCNLACLMCYNVSRSQPELSTQECYDILQQLAEAGTLRLALTGGEILLRKDFFLIANRARKLGFALNLKTNGTLITPAIADQIAALTPFRVDFSLLGANPQTVKRIMGGRDTLNKILNGIRLLRERDVRVSAHTLLMALNVQERREIARLATEMDAPIYQVFNISPNDEGIPNSQGHQLTQEHISHLLAEDNSPVQLQSTDPDSRTCAVGLHSCLIDPYGQVFPCVELRILAGDLRAQSFAEIWRGSATLQELRESHTLGHFETCCSCVLRPYCVSRCSGLAWKEHGDLYGAHTLACQQAQARFRQIHSEQFSPHTLWLSSLPASPKPLHSPIPLFDP